MTTKKVDDVLSKKTAIPKPPKREEVEKPVFKPLYPVAGSTLSTGPQKIDVNTFNVSDLYLDMTPEDVSDVALQNDFEVTNISYAVPSFMITAFEQDCRADGLYQTRLIHECVRERAKNEDVYYISDMTLKRQNEEIIVSFSSALSGADFCFGR